jgi:hypothetical protein
MFRVFGNFAPDDLRDKCYRVEVAEFGIILPEKLIGEWQGLRMIRFALLCFLNRSV